MFTRTALALVLALLVALPAMGQDYQKGKAAAKRGDYATALKEWRPLAEQGLTLAQHDLGILYAKGRGVKQNYRQAVKWYRKAAIAGYSNAQYLLGAMYAKGRGVTQDYAEAVKWYRKAANNRKHTFAQFSLGVMYSKGRGVKKNPVVAHMWYSLAAAGGLKFAASARSRTAKDMTPTQIHKAQELAREWRAKQKKK